MVPVLEDIDGRLALLKVGRQQDRQFEVLAAVEAIALQDILDPAVEALDYALCLHHQALDYALCLHHHRQFRGVADTKVGAVQVELALSRCRALVQG